MSNLEHCKCRVKFVKTIEPNGADRKTPEWGSRLDASDCPIHGEDHEEETVE